jgi:Organic solute transporter Ostalpha
MIYTVSYSVALYALVLFYVACRDLLRPFNPVPKFVMIKSVVFMTYWQVHTSVLLFCEINPNNTLIVLILQINPILPLLVNYMGFALD